MVAKPDPMESALGILDHELRKIADPLVSVRYEHSRVGLHAGATARRNRAAKTLRSRLDRLIDAAKKALEVLP